jgi:hypothetical protein
MHTLSPASNTSNGRFGLAAVQVQSTGTQARPAEALKLSTLQAILCVSAGGHISRQQGINMPHMLSMMMQLQCSCFVRWHVVAGCSGPA